MYRASPWIVLVFVCWARCQGSNQASRETSRRVKRWKGETGREANRHKDMGQKQSYAGSDTAKQKQREGRELLGSRKVKKEKEYTSKC